jgi:diacylglycerol kinase (ATP)
VKTLFIINPQAGRGAGLRTWQRLQKLVAREKGVDAVVPANATRTRTAAAEAVRAGIERVIVVGGDGTLTTVVGELARTDTVLGVIPAGTGNDFCRNNGIPGRLEEALAVAMGTQTRRIDLGQVAGRHPFLNAAGLGFDAEVATAAAAFPARLGGTLPYLLGALSTLVWYRPVRVDVSVDGQRHVGPAMLVAVANGRCYGGGMQIAPAASPDDGELDVCIAGPLRRWELLRLLRRVYTGGHVTHPQVRMLRGRQVRLRVADPVRLHLDGEPFCSDTLDFQVLPRTLQVAAPPTFHHDAGYTDIPDTRAGTPESLLWWDC